MRIVLATSNAGKVREAAAILAPSGIEVVTLPLWLGDVETGVSFEENAHLKASAALRMLQQPVLAEDSGIEVDALGGAPGIHSARFARDAAGDEENNDKLLRLLDGVPAAKRTARYRAVAVLLLPSGAVITGSGVFEGAIATAPRGGGGFGYDPIFLPAGMDLTGAELSPEAKDAVSHRGQALRAVAAQL